MDDPAMAAAVAQPRPPPPPRAAGGTGSRRRGFFTFMKDGALVTTRNPGIFVPLAALHAARSLAMLAGQTLPVWYFGLKDTIGDEYDGSQMFDALLDKLNLLAAGGRRWWVLPAAGLVSDVSSVAFLLAIQAATATAAVASFSSSASSAAASSTNGPGRTSLTLGSLLVGKKQARWSLVGPMATAVFVKVVTWLGAVACTAVVQALITAADAYGGGAVISGEVLYMLLQLLAVRLLYNYCTAVGKVAVVVSAAAAEPGGLRAAGGGALRQARRLVRGGRKAAQATVHLMLSRAMNRAVRKVGVAAAASFGVGGLAAAVVVYVLVGVVEVLYMATVTAFYFECKRSTEEEKEGHHIHME